MILALSFNIVMANEANAVSESAKIENYISSLYNRIDFSNSERLSYTVFNHAMRGYINLKGAGKITGEREVITICDFNQPSTFNRFWVIDLAKKKVLCNTYVAHGQGTGEDCAMTFSNKKNSHQSSIGFYVTTEVYNGDHGTSLRLEGMDQGFNDAAFDRDIVVHGADYVSDKYICDNQRLGRSWGCPALPEKLAASVIDLIKEGTCLFIYYPQPKYLATGYWLNKKVVPLPTQLRNDDMIPTDMNQPQYRTIQYIHNGTVDSVKKIALD
jgi:hypothetical protein